MHGMNNYQVLWQIFVQKTLLKHHTFISRGNVGKLQPTQFCRYIEAFGWNAV